MLTPQSIRKRIVLFGSVNAGKSSLINALSGQELSIVSDCRGTTTDPVAKSVELLPFGPVVLVDTAGVDDLSLLGRQRQDRTEKEIASADLVLLMIAADQFSAQEVERLHSSFSLGSHCLVVITQTDKWSESEIISHQRQYPDHLMVSVYAPDSIKRLREKIIRYLFETEKQTTTLIGDLLPSGSTVVMVVPIDSEAPKGRLILPQVRLIRDCLDHGVRCHVVRDTELRSSLEELSKVDLIVTDSQVFKTVSAICREFYLDRKAPFLTSFSILMAKEKGDLSLFLSGIKGVGSLEIGSRVLIAEACSHNASHEDIARNKIPMLLNRYTGHDLSYTFVAGKEYPSDLSFFDLIIHCGGCMLTPTEMNYRLVLSQGIPITNFGLLLAFFNGILEESIEVFPHYRYLFSDASWMMLK